MKEGLIRSEILSLVRNYVECRYPLSSFQIRTLLPVKAEESELLPALKGMVGSKELIEDTENHWFTLPEASVCFTERKKRKAITQHKLQKVSIFLRLLSLLPLIRIVSLTGSCALENADEEDDVDIMIITSPNTLFVCRIYITILLGFLRLRRKRSEAVSSGSICANIWIDDSYRRVPPQKRNLYSAREVINAQALISKNSAWELFLTENPWIFEKLPNAPVAYYEKEQQKRQLTQKSLLSRINTWLAHLQLWYMKPHVTNEFISKTQLWLHPQVRS